MKYSNFFALFGFTTSYKYSKYIIAFHMLIIWTLYIGGCFSRVNLPAEYAMSYLVSLLVFITTIVSATVSLIETLRTSHFQELSHKKLLKIDEKLWFLLGKEFEERITEKFMLQTVVYATCIILFTTMSMVLGFEGYFIFDVYSACLIKVRTFQMILNLERFRQRIEFLNKCRGLQREVTVIQVKSIYNLLIDINSLYNKSFECSLLTIVFCYLFDAITNTYWLFLVFLGILPFENAIVYFTTLLPLAMQILSLSHLGHMINKERENTISFINRHISSKKTPFNYLCTDLMSFMRANPLNVTASCFFEVDMVFLMKVRCFIGFKSNLYLESEPFSFNEPFKRRNFLPVCGKN